jgi:hypothetical protein
MIRTLFIAALAGSSLLALGHLHSETISVGGYFAVNIPASWIVKESRHINGEGSTTVYFAYGSSASIVILAINPPAPRLSLAEYRQLNDSDLARLAQFNQTVGWSLPALTKRSVNGIPALLRIEHDKHITAHILDLWIADRQFVVILRHVTRMQGGDAVVARIWQSIHPLVPAVPNAPAAPRRNEEGYFVGEI